MTNFYEFLNPYTDSTLDLELKCVAPDSFDIRDGFCAISEYFIVVHYVSECSILVSTVLYLVYKCNLKWLHCLGDRIQ
jgi:hypothetical protein